MKLLVVYCHPSNNSFTYCVKESFIKGAKDAGHEVLLSDLYQMKFNPVMSEEEYNREAFYRTDQPIPEDVQNEQEKIQQAEKIVFIYPDFWTSSPAMLEGWFQRVWTYGFAYGPNRTINNLKKIFFMMTMGGSTKDEIRNQQIEAMKTVMIGDRIHDRAEDCEFIVFDEMTRGYGNDKNRENRIIDFSSKAYEIGKSLK